MLVDLLFPPGLFANGTIQQAAGRWYDANLVRFYAGTVRPWGGWVLHAASAMIGKARAMIAWTDNDGVSWIAVGTHSKLYIVNRTGDIYDVTPVRATATLSAPFSTTNASPIVTVDDTAHGAAVGDYVTFSGASAVGGITVNGSYTVATVVNANRYTITHGSNATSTAGPGGGASVAVSYQISPGIADAYIGGGFGSGDFGEADYGESTGDEELVQPATVWSLDTFGENLLALNNSDGKLYIWSLNTSNPAVLVVKSGTTDVPVNSRALVVTETSHVLILGADGDPRNIAISDVRDETLWDAGLPSEAGAFPLQTGGRLMCGRRTRGATLLLTDQDAWIAIYNGGANPYSFDQVGTGCGAVSQGCAVAAGTTLIAWMGTDCFWAFRGDIQPLACEVSDRVFSNINRQRLSQVTGYHKQQYSEIVWHYPSSVAVENDRYVLFNYREGHWATGELERTCGADRGAFPYPLAVDGSGYLYRHESGFDYDDADVFVESGPIQFGNAREGEVPGERVFTALDLIPDESALGSVEATFFGRFYPDADETTFGPYNATNPTNVRFTTRHARMRLTGQDGAGDWRIGGYKLDIELGGLR